MMTKYQIVFLKLEASFKRIATNIKARSEIRKKKAFEKFRINARAEAELLKYKAIYLGKILAHKLKNLASLRSDKQSVKAGFAIWKLNASKLKLIEKIQKQNKE